MSSLRYGLNYIEVPRPSNFAGARGVTKLSRTKQTAISGGGGVGPVSASASKSDSTSSSKLDFLDLNGDRFPDIVSSGGVQFTKMTGGLESSRRFSLSGNVRETEAEAFSFGVGGNYAHSVGNSKSNVDSRGTTGSNGSTGQQMASLGVSGTITQGESDVEYDLMDMNGDGLADRIRRGNGIEVAFNIGYGFTTYEAWGSGEINHGENEGLSLGGTLGFTSGFNDGLYGFGGGFNLGRRYHCRGFRLY
ncbi:MAG: hypothetical protein GY801_17185 [bacterium]|nr:hypothetical protein [bacterium]